jgi:hypothetical protein
MLGNKVVRPNCGSVGMREDFITPSLHHPTMNRKRRIWEEWVSGRWVSDHHVCDLHTPIPDRSAYFDITHCGHEESFLYTEPFHSRWSKAVCVLIVGKDYPIYFRKDSPDIARWPAYSVQLSGFRLGPDDAAAPVPKFGVRTEALCDKYIELRDTFKLPVHHRIGLTELINIVKEMA